MIRGERKKNDGVYADDYQAVGKLKALADRSGVPFVVVHHLRKETAGDPLESVSGTAGITGSADTILVLKREPKDTFGLLYVRGRDVPEAEIAMQFDEATGKWLRLTGADDFRRSKERNGIIRALLDLGEPDDAGRDRRCYRQTPKQRHPHASLSDAQSRRHRALFRWPIHGGGPAVILHWRHSRHTPSQGVTIPPLHPPVTPVTE